MDLRDLLIDPSDKKHELEDDDFSKAKGKSDTIWLIALMRHLGVKPEEFLKTLTKERRDRQFTEAMTVAMSKQLGGLLEELIQTLKKKK